MKLVLRRSGDGNAGVLRTNGYDRCRLLEGGSKIPVGEYQVSLGKSSTISGKCILVLNVPGFTEVIIHDGTRKGAPSGSFCTTPLDGRQVPSTVSFRMIYTTVEAAIRFGKAPTLTVIE